MWLLLVGCAPEFAPPEDPGEAGGPVGVRTLVVDGLDVEAWYPAHPRHEGEPGEPVDVLGQIVDPSVFERVGNPEVATLSSPAVRDAEPHPDGPFPAILFSHGFAASRQQSIGLTTHLASRGFVVLSTDHRGRTLGDLVPCLFSPPMEGCALDFDDPAPDELVQIADFVGSGAGGLPVRPDALGLFGHSAGGISTTTVANADPRFAAIAPMAGGEVVTRDDLAVQRWSGTCDAVVQADGIEAAHLESATGDYYALVDAGHLAFADLCRIPLLRPASGASRPILGLDDRLDVQRPPIPRSRVESRTSVVGGC